MEQKSYLCACGGHAQVRDSRPTQFAGHFAIYRRRRCVKCGQTLTTYEITDLPRIVKDAARTILQRGLDATRLP